MPHQGHSATWLVQTREGQAVVLAWPDGRIDLTERTAREVRQGQRWERLTSADQRRGWQRTVARVQHRIERQIVGAHEGVRREDDRAVTCGCRGGVPLDRLAIEHVGVAVVVRSALSRDWVRNTHEDVVSLRDLDGVRGLRDTNGRRAGHVVTRDDRRSTQGIRASDVRVEAAGERAASATIQHGIRAVRLKDVSGDRVTTRVGHGATIKLDAVTFVESDVVAVDGAGIRTIVDTNAAAFRTVVRRATPVLVEVGLVEADRVTTRRVLQVTCGDLNATAIGVQHRSDGALDGCPVERTLIPLDQDATGVRTKVDTEVVVAVEDVLFDGARGQRRTGATAEEHTGDVATHVVLADDHAGTVRQAHTEGEGVRVEIDTIWWGDHVAFDDQVGDREGGAGGADANAVRRRSTTTVDESVVENLDVVALGRITTGDDVVREASCVANTIKLVTRDEDVVLTERSDAATVGHDLAVLDNTAVAQEDRVDVTGDRQGGSQLDVAVLDEVLGRTVVRADGGRLVDDRAGHRQVIRAVRVVVRIELGASNRGARNRVREVAVEGRPTFELVDVTCDLGDTREGVLRGCWREAIAVHTGTWVNVVDGHLVMPR